MTFHFSLDLLLHTCKEDLFECCFLRRTQVLSLWDLFFLVCNHFRRASLRFKMPRYCLALTQTHFSVLADEAIFTCPISFVSTSSKVSCPIVMLLLKKIKFSAQNWPSVLCLTLHYLLLWLLKNLLLCPLSLLDHCPCTLLAHCPCPLSLKLSPLSLSLSLSLGVCHCL